MIGIVRPLCPASARNPGFADASAGTQDGAERTERTERNARRVGRVTADLASGAGWFWIGLNGRSLEDDQVEAAFLAPEEGPQQHRFQVVETGQEGSVLKVKAAELTPAEGLYLYVPQRPKGQLYTSLLDGLTAMTQFTLAGRVANGQANPIPAADGTVPPTWASLNEEQRAAWRACRAPGVHLVWGPPGTGKTRVIAAALQSLRQEGKTVLLVSGTNIAVDNALARAVAAINLRPGEMVRAGSPHLPEIADNPEVCLQELVRSRQQMLEQACEGLSTQIVALREDPAFGQLDDAVAALDGFDPAAYQEAAALVATKLDLQERSDELAAVVEEARTAAADALDAETTLKALATEYEHSRPARVHLAAAEAHQRELDDQWQTLNKAHQMALSYESERDRLSALIGGKRFGARALKAEAKENEELLRRAHKRDQELRRLVSDRVPYLQSQIEAEVFTVAVTRAKRRLYLVGNAATIRGRKAGPLGVLRRMIEAGTIPVIPAVTILDPRHAPTDPVAGELWHALRGQATVLGLTDEEMLPGELIHRIDAATSSIWLWSPWAGKRAEQFLPHLKDARDRGVLVHPVILPPDEVNKHLKDRHEEVAREFPGAIYLWHMHQKIALIDDRLAFLGSMNMLGHAPGSRLEVMTLLQSRTLVSDLMAHERTDQLANPPACQNCGIRANRVKGKVARGNTTLHWYCRACSWEPPFPARPGARNQPRP